MREGWWDWEGGGPYCTFVFPDSIDLVICSPSTLLRLIVTIIRVTALYTVVVVGSSPSGSNQRNGSVDGKKGLTLHIMDIMQHKPLTAHHHTVVYNYCVVVCCLGAVTRCRLSN